MPSQILSKCDYYVFVKKIVLSDRIHHIFGTNPCDSDDLCRLGTYIQMTYCTDGLCMWQRNTSAVMFAAHTKPYIHSLGKVV